ncbi:MAG TPA: hypothetical protein VFW10_16570, partial [Steroidobacteraceae bacterium]|nr:hypothetical protein [Steroidobacteraceae bacterium]
LLLGNAEHGCLIANSLRGERTFAMEVLGSKSESESATRPAAEAIGHRAASRELQTAVRQLR